MSSFTGALEWHLTSQQLAEVGRELGECHSRRVEGRLGYLYALSSETHLASWCGRRKSGGPLRAMVGVGMAMRVYVPAPVLCRDSTAGPTCR